MVRMAPENSHCLSLAERSNATISTPDHGKSGHTGCRAMQSLFSLRSEEVIRRNEDRSRSHSTIANPAGFALAPGHGGRTIQAQ